MSFIGSIEPFNPNKDGFQSYMDRMEQYFIVNTVEQETKVPLFITLVGGETYNILKKLLHADTPSGTTYKESVDALQNYLAPKRLVIAECFTFYQCTQKSSETISDFIMRIKELAKHFEFGQFLDEALRDRLVCGMASDLIQRKLLSVPKLTFKAAVE
ncbi:hypothetical protein ILUMI_11779 [Ignelater luminosus]|uniref:Paraneoplastic antigen Ma-like C-terminal domain-containing protein n=1 Tax=Ignelater luminosus TaxID=2038154 RepID=A0A8K0D0T8_IGNLU|nr:hypothetical protein ILUMI_11779 [Ignelater luminosus]